MASGGNKSWQLKVSKVHLRLCESEVLRKYSYIGHVVGPLQIVLTVCKKHNLMLLTEHLRMA